MGGMVKRSAAMAQHPEPKHAGAFGLGMLLADEHVERAAESEAVQNPVQYPAAQPRKLKTSRAKNPMFAVPCESMRLHAKA